MEESKKELISKQFFSYNLTLPTPQDRLFLIPKPKAKAVFWNS